MSVQRIHPNSLKTDLYLDLAEMVSGLLLVGFLWTHMLFVGVILLGAQSYDSFAAFLDRYYLSYVGIPFIGLVALVHVFAVCRRIPNRYREFWAHARLVKHPDTWVWIFQLITAAGIAVLASMHVSSILLGWPIEAVKSADRMTSFWWFYLILLVLGEYHAGFGLYRIMVKWGWIDRHTVGWVTKMITLLILILGVAAMFAFVRLGGAL
ncbi:succinate dehydrogenase [Desulforudis sp. 1088]|uniref:succinate dehydrogenase n=1 Tax=unclassified Candidatus Desulforudis TaxID=2635950 RepID=UPI00346F9219